MIKKHDPAKFHVHLKVIMKNKKGQYLLLQSNSRKARWRGSNDLPGGRINKDEIIDREIKEEVGPRIKYNLRPDPVSLAKIRYAQEPERFYVLFEAHYLSGKIKLSDEHIGYTWQEVNRHNINKIFPRILHQLMSNYLKWNI